MARFGFVTGAPRLLWQSQLIGKVTDRRKLIGLTSIFLSESLILAQNERWQRGLGMQVEREAFASIFRERSESGQWRKGE